MWLITSQFVKPAPSFVAKLTEAALVVSPLRVREMPTLGPVSFTE